VNILAAGLLYRQYGVDSMTMHMQNRASVQIHQLKNINMHRIGVLLHYLVTGTVLGIISLLAVLMALCKSFTCRWRLTKPSRRQQVMVAIPALVAYRYFQRRVVDIIKV
jgi:biopolymer transport protein ExbB